MKVYYEDLPEGNGSPEFELCRKLIEDGMDPNEYVEFWRKDVSHPDFLIKRLGSGAELTVVETGQGPKFRKFVRMTEKSKQRLRSRRPRTVVGSDRTAI